MVRILGRSRPDDDDAISHFSPLIRTKPPPPSSATEQRRNAPSQSECLSDKGNYAGHADHASHAGGLNVHSFVACGHAVPCPRRLRSVVGNAGRVVGANAGIASAAAQRWSCLKEDGTKLPRTATSKQNRINVKGMVQ